MTNALAIVLLVLSGFLWAGAIGHWIDWLAPSSIADDWPTLQSNFAGRRANYIPRAGQVWKSSDPRRLSAFRIVSVDAPLVEPSSFFYGWGNDWKGCKAYIEMITNPGIAGKTARTIEVKRFQVLGSKGYTRVS